MAPVTLRLKSGSGPVTVSGLHLVGEEKNTVTNTQVSSRYQKNSFKAFFETELVLLF